ISAGIGRMELYDMRDRGGLMGFAAARPSGLRKTDKRVIRLTDCLSITPAPGESCPTDCSAFFLNTTSCTYTIAAPTQEDWMTVLCQLAFQVWRLVDIKDKYTALADNELYTTWGAGQFQVTVQSTDASQRCRMSGSYLLSSEKEAICLLNLKTGQAIYHWPYRLLRRFGQVKGGIMIEAGRRCHTGEGQFIFLSKQGSQIKRAIEDAIMHQSVQELLAQATALPQQFASQPPSPKIPRRYISLPDPPPFVKSPVSSPDDVLYTVIFPQPKPRSKMNLPKVPMPPGLSPNTNTDVTMDKEKEWRSPQETSKDNYEEAPYTNWSAKTTAEQDQPNIEDLYSTVNFVAKRKNRQPEGSDDQEQPNTEQHTPVITSSEIPVNFKQTLSNILFKDPSKIPPPFPPRSRGGSSDQLDRIDEQMTD
uniref:IRS-type PTB domain-containing protein n=1 Tax=Sinocyclocheilus grahami TaxID=75366 RepID=A0A672P598_SINGR